MKTPETSTRDQDGKKGAMEEERPGPPRPDAPALDENSRTLLIEAEVPNADGMLKPGYFAHVTMNLGHDRALFIPSSAVLRYAGVARVFIFKDGAVRSREVTTGSAEGEQIEIISGLNQGEKVVVSDVDRLADGRPVVAKEQS